MSCHSEICNLFYLKINTHLMYLQRRINFNQKVINIFASLKMTCSIIDFSINGPSTVNRLHHNGPLHPFKIQENNCKSINLVIRIELTEEILMLLFSNFLRNSTINFRVFLYLITCFPRVAVSLLCRLQTVSKIHVPIYPYLISELRRNCSTL